MLCRPHAHALWPLIFSWLVASREAVFSTSLSFQSLRLSIICAILAEKLSFCSCCSSLENKRFITHWQFSLLSKFVP